MTHTAMLRSQRHLNRKASSRTVPKIRLYVEDPAQQEAWYVNVGHVADRGRWRTEPHSHPAYGQVIFVRKGRGAMNLEGWVVPFEGPCVLLLPTECVHGLDYEVEVDRWVVTVEASYLARINVKLPEFRQLWTLPRMVPLSGYADAATDFHALILKLQHEVTAKAIGHVVETEGLFTLLLLALARAPALEQRDKEGATPSAARLADRFRELIEQHYRNNLPLQSYLTTMAVSPKQLRAACAAATGLSPIKMIHARLIAEAKRNLIFGDMSVEQIACWLGFSNAPYFTRFFRREVAQSPSQFRIAARQQSHRRDK